MLNGELVKKAISTFGAEIVEEVISQVDLYQGDHISIKTIYEDLKKYDYVDCIDFLYNN